MEEVLKILEDHSIAYLMRTENYKKVDNAITNHGLLPDDQMKLLLKIFAHDLNQDTKYAVNILKLLSTILKRLQSEETSLTEDLLPTASAILSILSKTAPLHKVQSLQHLCLDVLLAYSDGVYKKLGVDYREDLLALLDQYMSSNNVECDIKNLILDIIIKVLNVLGAQERKDFVLDGLSVWFSRVVPAIFTSTPLREPLINLMEMVIQNLNGVDYSENPQWCALFKNISTVDKYPASLKTLLASGDSSWHLAWCCIVKLLGTKLHKSATLINSLLSVLESAFKMTTEERCKAFYCWNVLIENFSLNMDQFFTSRRIKLLLIPLVVNNAKEEKSASYKFDSWWLLLKLLQPKIDQYMDSIVVPFLQFCFGQSKPKEGQTPPIVPGLTFPKVKILAIEALMKILGHSGSSDCVSENLTKLPGAILNPQNMVTHVGHWMHAIKEATILIANVNKSGAEADIKCLYQAVVKVMTEINDRINQETAYKEFLKILSLLVQKSQEDSLLAGLMFNIIAPCLINEKSGVMSLENKYRGCGEVSAEYIFKLLLCPAFKEFYSPTESSIDKLKILTDVGVSCSPDGFCKWLLQELPIDEDFLSHSLTWWMSLTKSVIENKCQINDTTAKDIFIWPITKIEYFTEVNLAVHCWSELYTNMKENLEKDTKLHGDILNIMMLHYKDTVIHNAFIGIVLPLTVTSILEIDPRKLETLETELNMLHILFDKIDETSDGYRKTLLNNMTTSLVCALNSLSETKNGDTVNNVILSINKFINQVMSSSKIVKKEKESPIVQLLCAVENIMKKNICLSENFREFLSDCHKISISNVKQKVNSLLNTFESIEVLAVSDENKSISNITPLSKDKNSSKKSKSTGKIVKKISDGDEEFVVVKSNWKFNPHKLTEHQKEVMKRKREDIPALYQDLSQSQDEVKIKSWKMPGYKSDSQDVSTSVSASLDKNETSDTSISNILKDIPNYAHICPNIVNTIFKDDAANDKSKPHKAKENSSGNMTDTISPKPTNKNVSLKSPRMSIKDKIQKNVQNLLGGTSPLRVSSPVHNTQSPQLENTPESCKSSSANPVYMSAPPKIDSERPSRTKRKPKKLEEDFEVLEMVKRKRNSIDTDTRIYDSRNEVGNRECMVIKSTSPINIVEEKFSSPNNVEITETLIEPKTIVEKQSDKSNCDNDVSPPVTPSYKGSTNETDVSPRTVPQAITAPKIVTPKYTPKPKSKQNIDVKTPTSKKKNRLEMQLAIDMVEGHPLLTAPEEVRSTRKGRLLNDSLTKNNNKEKTKSCNTPQNKDNKITKVVILSSDKENNYHENTIVIHDDSPKKELHEENVKPIINKCEFPHSEDFIESSQESPVSTPKLSIKSSRHSKNSGKKRPKPSLKSSESSSTSENESDTVSTSVSPVEDITSPFIHDEPVKMTVNEENGNNLKVCIGDADNCEAKFINEMGENTIATMNTQLVSWEKSNVNDIERDEGVTDTIYPNSTDNVKDLAANTNSIKHFSDETISEMDTEPFTPMKVEKKLNVAEVILIDDNSCDTSIAPTVNLDSNTDIIVEADTKPAINYLREEKEMLTNKIITESVYVEGKKTHDFLSENSAPSSPFTDDKERDNDFLNNTYDISPIKVSSPQAQPLSPPPKEENSNDFVVIKLTSPVKCNGEPIDKCDSPEIFTNEKLSPDKQNLSPPRANTSASSGSPSSLSLKKNRTQARPSGRGAQMLGLCQPGSFYLKPNVSCEKSMECDSPMLPLTPARRNLKIAYANSADIETPQSEVINHVDHFLSLTKELPSATSSPSGPILKRKHCEIADEATQSPASKRKRVSFHDPPVSTTVSVHKYIEETIRSPQQNKNKERKNKSMFSKKKLQMLPNEAVEAPSSDSSGIYNSDNDEIMNVDTQADSLADTPMAIIVNKDELANTGPIYPNLVDCCDSIDAIVGDLSTESMKEMLLKDLDEVKTIGDLAKLTELEVNRLSIISPKVETVMKALAKYDNESREKSIPKPVQMSNVEIQTEFEEDYFWSTLKVRSTKEVIEACLEMKENFIQEMSMFVSAEVKHKMAHDLPAGTIGDILCERLQEADSNECDLILTNLVQKHPEQFLDKTVSEAGYDKVSEKLGLENIQDYLLKNLTAGELVKFCSTILQKKIPEK